MRIIDKLTCAPEAKLRGKIFSRAHVGAQAEVIPQLLGVNKTLRAFQVRKHTKKLSAFTSAVARTGRQRQRSFTRYATENYSAQWWMKQKGSHGCSNHGLGTYICVVVGCGERPVERDGSDPGIVDSPPLPSLVESVVTASLFVKTASPSNTSSPW